jgi:hypothetical protein
MPNFELLILKPLIFHFSESEENTFISRNQKKHRCVHLDDAKTLSTEEFCCRWQSLLINGNFLIQIFCIQSILLFLRYNLNFKFADPSTYQDIPSPLLTDVPFPINPFLLHSFLPPIFPSFSSPKKLLHPPTVSLVARPGPTARRACKA